jgi:hypothetical protein
MRITNTFVGRNDILESLPLQTAMYFERSSFKLWYQLGVMDFRVLLDVDVCVFLAKLWCEGV